MNDSFKQKQTLATTQTQTLTPMQVQYVRLLEMNTPAIEDEVARRLDENPALIKSENDVEGGSTADSFNESAEDLQRADYRSEEDMPVTPSRSYTDNADSRRFILESSTADEDDMADRLRQQLAEMTFPDPRTRAYAEYIIGTLDANGRMTRSLSAIADDIMFSTGVEVTADDLRPALEAIRSLDPPGVGAADLRDCLLIQLDRRPQDDSVRLARLIVDRYFDILASHRPDRLISRTRSSHARVEEALRVIRSLNPKPGNSDSVSIVSDRAMHITPDFVVESDETDPEGRRFLISMPQRIPELTVAEWHVADDCHNAEAAAFVRNRTREAGEFIDLLRRRSETLMAVMKTIVDIQSEFFRTEDPATIRPMILKEIAARTGRDVSVISRAAAGKYVATAGGIYPLKMFFNERPTENSELSVRSIQHTLREIVDEEDKTAPLSDDAIAAALKSRGMDIARRTVVKYREQMGIPNSRGRRVIPAGPPAKTRSQH